MAPRVLLCGADVVLPDRVASNLTVVIEDGRIADLVAGPREVGPGETRHDLRGQFIVPGFIDVHVHGVLGVDVMDDGTAVQRVARLLPQFGVTAFCPTSIACSPEALASFLAAVGAARMQRDPDAARVLPAHLETGFINPDYRGAQPLEWITAWDEEKTSGVFFSSQRTIRRSTSQPATHTAIQAAACNRKAPSVRQKKLGHARGRFTTGDSHSSHAAWPSRSLKPNTPWSCVTTTPVMSHDTPRSASRTTRPVCVARVHAIASGTAINGSAAVRKRAGRPGRPAHHM